MAEAFRIGLKPHEFMEMTWRELHACFLGFKKRQQYDEQVGFTQAYYGALWQRVKKIPKLKDFLRRLHPEHGKPQSPADMRKALIAAFEGLGAKVIRRTKGEPD